MRSIVVFTALTQDQWIPAAFMGVIALGSAVAAVLFGRRARVLRPALEDVRESLVERTVYVQGTVLPGADVLRAPASGRPCVQYAIALYRADVDDERRVYFVLDRVLESRSIAFSLVGERGGRLRIEGESTPGHEGMDTSVTVDFHGAPGSVQLGAMTVALPALSAREEYSLRELLVPAQGRLHAIGTVHARMGELVLRATGHAPERFVSGKPMDESLARDRVVAVIGVITTVVMTLGAVWSLLR